MSKSIEVSSVKLVWHTLTNILQVQDHYQTWIKQQPDGRMDRDSFNKMIGQVQQSLHHPANHQVEEEHGVHGQGAPGEDDRDWLGAAIKEDCGRLAKETLAKQNK